ncbi:MAG TPA: histidinol-phosphate transaminase [Polyangia bacterium]
MICPYEPGKSIEEVRRELGLSRVIKLASNENPLGPSPRVIDALAPSSLELHMYPDQEGHCLQSALGRWLDVAPEQIVVGAGSTEIMRLLADAYLRPGDEALMADLCFPVYETVTRVAGGRPVVVPLDEALGYDLEAMLAAITRRTKLVFLASPNNPTGARIPCADLQHFVARLPSTVLCVLDLAYAEYVEGAAAEALELATRHSNLVLLFTFSKVYGLAGLRVGYAVANRDVASWLKRVRIPFTISTAAQVAARVALEDRDHVRRTLALNRRSRELLVRQSPDLGLAVRGSGANFVLLECPAESEEMSRRLLRRGIVVRPMRHPRLARCVRVTTGTEEQTGAFLEAVRDLAVPRADGAAAPAAAAPSAGTGPELPADLARLPRGFLGC